MDDQLKIIYTMELEKGWRFETTDGIIVVGIGPRESEPLLDYIL